MSVPSSTFRIMTTTWAAALSFTAEILNRNEVPWMLVGSAATALRGVGITPGDLDIAVSSASDVVRAAKIMPTPDVKVPQDPAPEWLSTAAAPTLSLGGPREQWTFGRWIIDDFRVEIAYIESPRTAALYLETRSPLSWNDRELLNCAGHTIPTVPIEPQLATMIAREQKVRLNATLAAINGRSLDPSRLRRAIEDKRTEVPELSIPPELQRLLSV